MNLNATPRVRRNGTLVGARRYLNFTDSSTVSWAGIALDLVNGEIDMVAALAGASAIVLAAWIDPSFGNGSDGNVTLGSNTTLVRDMQYNTLDLNGFNLDADGYRIRCRVLKNSGGVATISNSGDSAVNRVGGSGTQAHSLGNGASGSNGGTSGASGTNGTARTASWPATVLGGTAGDGGAGGASGAGQSGGSAGAAGPINWTSGTPSYGGAYFMDMTWSTTTVNAVNGGGGGGGGGAAAAGGSAGGGGGAGGGVCTVHAHTLHTTASSIVIAADAGNAGNVAGTNAGGGGGGGGGYSKLVYQVAQGSLPTMSSAAGSGSTAVGTGVNGNNGGTGVSEIWQLGT